MSDLGLVNEDDGNNNNNNRMQSSEGKRADVNEVKVEA